MANHNKTSTRAAVIQRSSAGKTSEKEYGRVDRPDEPNSIHGRGTIESLPLRLRATDTEILQEADKQEVFVKANLEILGGVTRKLPKSGHDVFGQ